ncbi:MAG TPA: hypothetical protein VKA15_17455, partial [Isosphaeraceae bacterium]|nr:hypothetical protein [Isosphaeraceae bacterium]
LKIKTPDLVTLALPVTANPPPVIHAPSCLVVVGDLQKSAKNSMGEPHRLGDFVPPKGITFEIPSGFG